jgi:hypothetical protein
MYNIHFNQNIDVKINYKISKGQVNQMRGETTTHRWSQLILKCNELMGFRVGQTQPYKTGFSNKGCLQLINNFFKSSHAKVWTFVCDPSDQLTCGSVSIKLDRFWYHLRIHLLFWWKPGILCAQRLRLIPRALSDSNGRKTLSKSFNATKPLFKNWDMPPTYQHFSNHTTFNMEFSTVDTS